MDFKKHGKLLWCIRKSLECFLYFRELAAKCKCGSGGNDINIQFVSFHSSGPGEKGGEQIHPLPLHLVPKRVFHFKPRNQAIRRLAEKYFC